MIYKDFAGLKLSELGLGTMRLPVVDGQYSHIDRQELKKMVKYAMDNGVNYFDTAYGYHDGDSESAIGEALRDYPRESYYLADKFPGYDLSYMDKVEEVFEEQLRRTGAGYFDFYMFHNVYEKNVDPYLDEKYGIFEYLMKQKENGRIKHLGFSAHGRLDVIEKLLDAYGEHMEFCQLQINYVDWEFQQAREKLELLKSKNIPVWVMEPVRGGMLASLSKENESMLKKLRPEESVCSWAFRFLQGLSGVGVILSGMSNMEQLKENIDIFKENKPLTQKENEAVFAIAKNMLSAQTLPCTACRYCTAHCPMELDIPLLLSLYNEYIFTGGGYLAPMAVDAMDEDKRPSACIGCKSCEAVCPQSLKISEAMEDFTNKLGASPEI